MNVNAKGRGGLMTKRLRYLLGAAALSLVITGVAQAADVGTTGAAVLELVPDARSTGIGETFCGVGDEVYTVYYNPAGLGNLYNSSLFFSNNQTLSTMNNQSFGFLWSLSGVRSENVLDLGSIAFVYTSFATGNITRRDVFGAAHGNFDASNKIYHLAYGKSIYKSSSTGNVLLGAAGKLIDEDLDDTTIQSTAVDAGLMWESVNSRVRGGVSILNMGHYGIGGFDLPLKYKAGVSWRSKKDDLLLAGDIDAPAHGDTSVHAGAEYWMMNTIALRLGYSSQYDTGPGLTAGFGISIKQVSFEFFYAREITIDYAFVPQDEFSSLQKVSVNMKFGAD
jgi:hypothetical protein